MLVFVLRCERHIPRAICGCTPLYNYTVRLYSVDAPADGEASPRATL